MQKILVLLSFMAQFFVPFAYGNVLAIKRSLSCFNIKAPIFALLVAGMKTIQLKLACCIPSDDGNHVIYGPLHDVDNYQP